MLVIMFLVILAIMFFPKQCLHEMGCFHTFSIPADYTISVEAAVSVNENTEQPQWFFRTDPNYDEFGRCAWMREMCELVEPCPNYAQTPHCRFDVYDNALAAIYLSKRGLRRESRFQ